MKKALIGIRVALAALVAIALIVSCDTGTNADPGGDGDSTSLNLVGVSDWSIVKGYQNDTDVPLKISGAEIEGAKTLKVSWASSMDFRGCELFALLPEGEDLGAYDGIQFDIRLPASANFMLLLRNPNGGTTFKVWEEYVYRGTDDADTYVWVTVKKPFSGATEMTDWGDPDVGTSLKTWLTANKDTQKQINLNPVLNVGGGSALDTAQVTYFDNIGFYTVGPDGVTDPDDEPAATADDVFTCYWDFDTLVN